MKTSKANAKLRKLAGSIGIPRAQIQSFALSAGASCPGAVDCLAKVVINEIGKRKLKDGDQSVFRCYAASQEVVYTETYNMRRANFAELRDLKTEAKMAKALLSSVSERLKVLRIHDSGDFFNKTYFRAWIRVARERPDTVFYAYTKSLPYWVDLLDEIPSNLRLTASRGGRWDYLIGAFNLPEAVVVESEEHAESLGLEVDYDDSHAYHNKGDFALVVHGSQPKGRTPLNIIN